MDFIPYKINEIFTNSFYQIPKDLFVIPYYKDLSSDSKILYSLLLDRLALSSKNNWIDENGDVFLIFSRKEAQSLLNLSDKTITKAFKQLNEHKLISEKKQGLKKNNLIYVGKINHLTLDKSLNRKNYDSGGENFTILEPENLRCNNTKYNKTNINNTKSIYGRKNSDFEQRSYSSEQLRKLYKNFTD